MSSTANIQSRNFLIDVSNYKAWYCEYTGVAEEVFELLYSYLEICWKWDLNGKLFSKDNKNYKASLRIFKKILFKLLQTNVDDYDQDAVGEYRELKDANKYVTKKVIRKLTDMYGIVKQKDCVKVLERYMKGYGRKDNFNYNLDISKISISKIFLAALYMNNLYWKVRALTSFRRILS